LFAVGFAAVVLFGYPAVCSAVFVYGCLAVRARLSMPTPEC